MLAGDAKDGPGGQIYGMPTDFYQGLYVGMFWMYREGTDARIDTQLAVSRDGIGWSRVAGRQTFLPNAKEGSWDDGMSRAGRGINVVGDTIYLHYSMVNGPHRSAKFPKPERKYPPRNRPGHAAPRRFRVAGRRREGRNIVDETLRPARR